MQKIQITLINKIGIIFEYKFSCASILAFLTAFSFRLFPEILAGKWPLGFDTITYYAPVMENWSNGNFNPADFNYYAPLCFLLLYFAYSLSGNVFLTLKIFGPLLYGFLSFSLFFFTTKGLNWSNKKGLLACIVFSAYFVSLRISWDLYRNMLGLALLFIFLSFFKQHNKLSNKLKLTSSILATLIVLSHEITSAIMFFIIIGSFISEIFENKKPLTKVLKRSSWFAPPLLLFLFIFFASATLLGTIPGSLNYLTSTVRSVTYDSYQSLVSDISMVGILCFGGLLLFIIRGFWSDRILNLWLMVCLMGSLWPIVYPWFEIVPWNRWMYMLASPLILYTVNEIEGLHDSRVKKTYHNARKFSLKKVFFPTILMVISICYILSPLIVSSHTVCPSFLAPFERVSAYLPADFLSNTFPIDDCEDLEICLKFVNSKLDNHSVLIVHESLSGWASLYIDEDKNVINYNFQTPLEGLKTALAQGYEEIHMIWWVEGLGWYNQNEIPAGFQQQFTSCRIAVYLYT